jgi:hypothetical protein
VENDKREIRKDLIEAHKTIEKTNKNLEIQIKRGSYNSKKLVSIETENEELTN